MNARRGRPCSRLDSSSRVRTTPRSPQKSAPTFWPRFTPGSDRRTEVCSLRGRCGHGTQPRFSWSGLVSNSTFHSREALPAIRCRSIRRRVFICLAGRFIHAGHLFAALLQIMQGRAKDAVLLLVIRVRRIFVNAPLVKRLGL